MRKTILSALILLSISVIIYSCQNATEKELMTYTTNGADIYKAKCQNCHGEKGEGLAALAPPLTDTTFLKVNKKDLSCFVKFGSAKPMVINGTTYDSKMPAFPEMEAIDIAQVIVYITNSFGNKQGMYSYEQVSKDLEACRPVVN